MSFSAIKMIPIGLWIPVRTSKRSLTTSLLPLDTGKHHPFNTLARSPTHSLPPRSPSFSLIHSKALKSLEDLKKTQRNKANVMAEQKETLSEIKDQKTQMANKRNLLAKNVLDATKEKEELDGELEELQTNLDKNIQLIERIASLRNSIDSLDQNIKTKMETRSAIKPDQELKDSEEQLQKKLDNLNKSLQEAANNKAE
eukprot:TRINITY_DN5984_c0_g2_i1.p1 TRINITY_DN5984_c0_g2~~TRINITY_DN5984_c0_g2_i1.p1  ORF type:complete len:199 (+),score=71.06 TRINITY_DN5984_c0_g2_i1:149-745(+)